MTERAEELPVELSVEFVELVDAAVLAEDY